MQFSTRTTYGLRAVINLAKHGDKKSVSLSKIANDEKISLKYLEKLFASLKKAGIVKAAKGMSGGYKLALKPSQTKIYDIIKALEGEMILFHCINEKGKIYCNQKHKCGATMVLDKVQQSVSQTLKNTNLSQLI